MTYWKDKTFEDFMIEVESEDSDTDGLTTLILEQASDTAEKFTELECKLGRIMCWDEETILGIETATFTKEAQEIFNVYYDEQCDELYRLLYNQLKELDE